MVGYQQVYRPAWVGQPQPVARPAGAPGLSTRQRRGVLFLGGAETLFGAAATWVGVRAAMKEKGFFSVMGWIVGIGGGLFTILNLTGLIGVAMTPTLPEAPAAPAAPAGPAA